MQFKIIIIIQIFLAVVLAATIIMKITQDNKTCLERINYNNELICEEIK